MSHFYGTLQGQAGRATRCGSKRSGLTTYAAGWGGAVRVHVFQDSDTDEDRYTVDLVPWGCGGGSPRRLAEGELRTGVEEVFG